MGEALNSQAFLPVPKVERPRLISMYYDLIFILRLRAAVVAKRLRHFVCKLDYTLFRF